MQTISLKIIWGLFFFIPFYPFNTTINMTYNIEPRDEVKKALDGQVNAWNKGDLEKAMSYYWDSPEILWVSKSGIQKGYQPVLDDFMRQLFNSNCQTHIMTTQQVLDELKKAGSETAKRIFLKHCASSDRGVTTIFSPALQPIFVPVLVFEGFHFPMSI